MCTVLGCAGDDTKEVGKIALHASLDGNSLTVGIDSTFKPYVDPCTMLELSTWSGKQWVLVQDDRTPEDFANGYFLDGAFVPPSSECVEGTQCVVHPDYAPNLNAIMTNLQVSAYVKVGTKPAPDAQAGAAKIDEFETEPLKGRVKVTNYYYRDDDCGDQPAAVSAEATRSGP
jgi:hypothetical protein